MYSVKSRSGRRGTVLTNYAHDMTRLMLRAPISWFSSGPVSNVKMGRNVRQANSRVSWSWSVPDPPPSLKFDGESDRYGLKAQKPYLDSLHYIALVNLGPCRPKNKKFHSKNTDSHASFLAGGTHCFL